MLSQRSSAASWRVTGARPVLGTRARLQELQPGRNWYLSAAAKRGPLPPADPRGTQRTPARCGEGIVSWCCPSPHPALPGRSLSAKACGFLQLTQGGFENGERQQPKAEETQLPPCPQLVTASVRETGLFSRGPPAMPGGRPRSGLAALLCGGRASASGAFCPRGLEERAVASALRGEGAMLSPAKPPQADFRPHKAVAVLLPQSSGLLKRGVQQPRGRASSRGGR